ncbi:UNVERIFIED_CONTAM: Pentatricopeptide repeat-containing protein, chloroplastic [Sesamum radiatum]|uniref:Pentatricopeptide repeat-containing protein, chloroplastic n=1 Tax=Sesamum radiatum TaxID=300843 RepID=A0AAW2JZY2_SESRA
MGKVSKALEVSDMMKQAGIKHNMKTYSMLMNGFINLKDWANAFSIFEDVIRDGLKPDVILYNNIIRAFCGMGNMGRAIRTVEEMKKERHRPTSRTFMPIIHSFARAGEMRRALDVFDMMRRSGCIPTVHTYNALILGLVEKRQMEKAVGILDEMLLAGISPNEHTYTTIMHGYASLVILEKLSNTSLRMQSALAVTKEMRAQNIPRNTFIYNILIDGWARRGDVWEAADLMQQMRQEGVQPDIHTYTSFINACCKAGDMMVKFSTARARVVSPSESFHERAMRTIEEMEAVGVKANVKTYTTLIHGWSRASLPEKALKCFEEMKQAGLNPDKAVYHCLMTSLLSRATIAEDYIYNGILNLCDEMVDYGLTVDMGTAVHWSKCLRKIERTGGSITEALQKTFPPDWNSHKTLNAISDVSDHEDGLEENNYDDSPFHSDTDGEDNTNFDERFRF